LNSALRLIQKKKKIMYRLTRDHFERIWKREVKPGGQCGYHFGSPPYAPRIL
jgi:hypothetical protein